MLNDNHSELAKAVLAGNRRALARAVAIVEDRISGHETLMPTGYPHGGRSHTIGITGPPGAAPKPVPLDHDGPLNAPTRGSRTMNSSEETPTGSSFTGSLRSLLRSPSSSRSTLQVGR
jgi:hypothetical protein